MANSFLILVLLTVVLLPVAVDGFDCQSYGSSYRSGYTTYEHCKSISNVAIGLIVVGIAIFILFIVCCCCCCPCCCLYNMCKKPRPVVGTTTTTVVNTQHIVQQPVQGAQYPAYQPVPTQPGYGGQPIPAGPYQEQPYILGPPPPYHTVAGPGYPMYPQPTPAQTGYAHVQPAPDSLKQPAYNPAYMQPS